MISLLKYDIIPYCVYIYKSDIFSDLKFEIQGDILIVDVKERKIVQRIQINGIKAEKTKKSILKNYTLHDHCFATDNVECIFIMTS